MLGKIILSFVSIFGLFGGWLADFNDTHIYNPNWSGHAKFHVGHTMIIGTTLGVASLYFLFISKMGTRLERLNVSTLLNSIYWFSQSLSILVPFATYFDPDFKRKMPVINGFQLTQLHLDIVLLTLCAIGYLIERANIKSEHVKTK
ncbi:DNA repair and recombination protein [Acrasis kona]|uniref:DNA repair and recombination protein n=1 Tax=Acrasis kona TaxID=1008807 RepID=A0AAW2YLK3_9EUKA